MQLDENVASGTLRERTLEIAKRHKASWIQLGQYLYTIYKDKHFKDWGYLTFETYVGKELHLKQTTAMKLLKSYYFLEKEEPKVLEQANTEEPNELIPSYESVNVLRLAKNNKRLTPGDVQSIRKSVFDEGREPREVQTKMRKLLSDRDDRDPQEVRQGRRNSSIKRLVTTLRSVGEELEAGKLLPAALLKQIDELAIKLEDELE